MKVKQTQESWVVAREVSECWKTESSRVREELWPIDQNNELIQASIVWNSS